MAYTTIDNPELYFQVKTYTGNASTNAITLDGDENMQPDMVWLKSRSYSDNHVVHDSVRGSTKRVFPNLTQAEGTEATSVTSFDSDGFTLGADGIANGGSGKTYVAWCWKESATAGFDMVTYTGNGSGRTISHSLSAVPHWYIVKERSPNDEHWFVYHQSTGNLGGTLLSTTGAFVDNVGYFNDTSPTSSVFSVGDGGGINTSSSTYIAYLWSEKQGFSKFGKYTGNGNADGPFIYTGFKPAWFLTKRTDSTDNWRIRDLKREPNNPLDAPLRPDLSNTENDGDNKWDVLSNGLKLRDTGTGENASGGTYIYMAFAEAPFVNSNGVPCNAR